MILRAYFATLGKLVLLLAAMAFTTAVGLMVLGAFLSTFPIHRTSPRDEKLKTAASAIGILAPALINAMRRVGDRAPSENVNLATSPD